MNRIYFYCERFINTFNNVRRYLMKKCKACCEEKPINEFFKNSRCVGGYAASCKTCCNTRTTRSRSKNKKQYTAAKTRYRKRKKEEFLAWKKQIGCFFCQESFPQCLELHHTDPSNKELEIAQLSTGNWERFLIEATKCVVVCANCHRKIHYGFLKVDVKKQYIFE